jgi:hypothetical protein
MAAGRIRRSFFIHRVRPTPLHSHSASVNLSAREKVNALVQINSQRPDLIFFCIHTARIGRRTLPVLGLSAAFFSLGRSRFIYFNGVGERNVLANFHALFDMKSALCNKQKTSFPNGVHLFRMPTLQFVFLI